MVLPDDSKDILEFDAVIVGAGPAGLSAAIRMKQLNPDVSVCVLEKASEVGLHTLSGAVLEPRALAELVPDYVEKGVPLNTKVKKDAFYFLTSKRSLRMPLPPSMNNHGNYIVQLSQVCKWLGEQAEALGVEIFPSFTAYEPLIDKNNRVVGVVTGDMGRDANGQAGANFQPGVELRARFTLFAEGCRGHNAQELMRRYDLFPKQPQTYGIGIKELWKVNSKIHEEGLVWHSVGWPLDSKTYGGSFIYHLKNDLVALGFVVGLDYQNPYLNPFKELQRFKHHPKISSLLSGGERVCYGARALNEGCFQSIPGLTFPGGALIGCAAGFLNTPKIKGTHTAMKSAMVAAETLIEAMANNQDSLDEYPQRLKESWLWEELYRARNVRPSFRFGLLPAMMYSALDQIVLRGKAPWTLKHHAADHTQLNLAEKAKKIDYPAPDGKISFDMNSSVYLSGTNHEADQPCHLRIENESVPVAHNLAMYAGPEQRYCPAGVYEYVEEKGETKLQINAQNCLHCKTCDIKDPTENIRWVTPEGGQGPSYQGM